MSKIRILSTSLLFAVVLLLPGKSPAQEQPTEICGGDVVQANAFIPIPIDTPNIFARAGRTEDAAFAKLYLQPIDQPGACILLGEATLSTDKWASIGKLPNIPDQQTGVLVLAFDDGDFSQAGASSPMVVFAGDTPPCQLDDSCEVNYMGSQFALSPRKLSMSSDTLRVGQLMPLADDQIQEVIYSVDGRQVYKSKELEPFQTRYVPGGKHSLERTVVLKSGQSLSDSSSLEHGALGEPFYLITAIYNRFAKVFNFVGFVLMIGLLWALGAGIVRLIHSRYRWREHHIASLSPRTVGGPVLPPGTDLGGSTPLDLIRRHHRIFVGATSIIVLSGIIYGFVLASFVVDGVSMHPTLQDKSRQTLFIFPAQIGKLTGSGYTPPRGKIVVVKEAEHNLFDSAITKQASYVVKRVIGLPGDRVVIADGIITIYNQEHPDGYVPDDEYGWVQDRAGSEYFRTDVTLKDNELFVVGDNRDESIDSRYYGPVRSSEIIGRVL